MEAPISADDGDCNEAIGEFDELEDFLNTFSYVAGDVSECPSRSFDAVTQKDEWLADFKSWWSRRQQQTEVNLHEGGHLQETAPRDQAISTAEAPEAQTTLEASHEACVRRMQCSISRLDGHSLVIYAPAQERVRWIKVQITKQWGIPVYEQTLLYGTRVCSDNEIVDEIFDSVADVPCCSLVCVRTCPFRFSSELAHPELQIFNSGDSIQHSGYGSYQAGFLSEVLNSADHYHMHIQFSSISDWTMIFIGVAKDSKRDWSNLTGAYIAYTNRCGGFFIDDFHSPGWISHEAVMNYFADHRQARVIDFVVSVDMPHGRLSCLTTGGVELASVQLEIKSEPIRFVANVCHPGHKVRIMP